MRSAVFVRRIGALILTPADFILRAMFWLGIILSSQTAFASLGAELNAYYVNDSFTTSSTNTSSTTYVALDLTANIDNNGRFYAGFHTGQTAISRTGTITDSFSSLDFGPFLMFAIDPKKIYTVMAGYNMTAAASYTSGSSTSTWQGTSLNANFGIMPEIVTNWYIGVRFNYYSPSYSSSTTTTTASTIAYSRSMMFPSFVLAYRPK